MALPTIGAKLCLRGRRWNNLVFRSQEDAVACLATFLRSMGFGNVLVTSVGMATGDDAEVGIYGESESIVAICGGI